MQINSLEKVIVSTGVGKLRSQANFKDKIIPEMSEELAAITGQKPQVRQAKKSISGFKLREGEIVGLSVTLRGKRMEDFIAKFVGATLPRIRDFRGINPKAIDKQGNLTIGIREHIVFPEVDQDKIHREFGLEVTFVSNVKDKAESYEFYKSLGVPLQPLEEKTKK